MVQPIDSFYIYPNSLGGELDLFWNLPSQLPSGHVLILFKKAGEEITSDDITAYFYLTNEIKLISEIPNPTSEDLQFLEQKKSELADFLTDNKMEVRVFVTDPTEYVDTICENGTEYFYRIYVQDTSTNELSEPALVSAVSGMTGGFLVFDSKEAVIKALEWVISSISAQNSESMNLPVFKEFPAEEGIDQWITVHRSSPESFQRFFGDVLYELDDQMIFGHIEKETIEVKWYCRNNPDRRDAINKFFRSRVNALKRYILHSGAIEALFGFLEDSVDSKDTNSNLFYSGMKISVMSDALTKKALDVAPIEPDFIPGSPG